MERIIIFGAAGYGRFIRFMLDDAKYQIMAFLDNNKDVISHTQEIDGVVVDSPQNINNYEYDYIILSVASYQLDMTRQLVSLGVEPRKIICFFSQEDIKWFPDTRIAYLRRCIHEIVRKKLSGSLAELGVYQGDFAKYINRWLPEKNLYLFDTFAGFDGKDNCGQDTYLESQGKFIDTNVKLVLSKMYRPDKCIVKKGWFPDSLEGMPEDESFCLVSLDADIYKPIYNGLQYFYPRLVTGGYIFVHDYGSELWDGVQKAVDDFCKESGAACVPVLDRCNSVILTK